MAGRKSMVPREVLTDLNELKALIISDFMEFRKYLDEKEKIYIERIQQLAQRCDLGRNEFDQPISIASQTPKVLKTFEGHVIDHPISIRVCDLPIVQSVLSNEQLNLAKSGKIMFQTYALESLAALLNSHESKNELQMVQYDPRFAKHQLQKKTIFSVIHKNMRVASEKRHEFFRSISVLPTESVTERQKDNMDVSNKHEQYIKRINKLQVEFRKGLGQVYPMSKYVVQNFVDPTNINLKKVDAQSWVTFQQKLNESAPFWPIRNPIYKEMYAVRRGDGNWYRTKLKYPKKDSDEYVMVLVDTHEVVNVQNNCCRIIGDADILNMNWFAVWASLYDIESHTTSANEFMKSHVVGNEFTVLFLHGQTYNSAAKVDLLFEHKGRLVSLRDTLIAAGHVKATKEKDLYQGRERQFLQDRSDLIENDNRKLQEKFPIPGEEISLIITNMTDKSSAFYGILEHDVLFRKALEIRLGLVYNENPDADNSIYVPKVGMICGIRLVSRDKTGPYWYRCKILKFLEPGKCEVLLIDDGRKQIVKSSLLRYLYDEFFQKEQMAIRYELVDVKHAEMAVIQAWLAQSPLHMKVQYVRKDLSTVFVAKIPSIGFVEWLASKPILKNCFDGMIEHVEMTNNELKFVIHTMKQVDELFEMCKSMTLSQDQLDPTTVTDWKVDEICIARYDDNQYYRGKIVQVNKHINQCLVYFVDFGNKSMVHFGDISRYIMYHGRNIMMTKYKLNAIQMIDGRWTPEAANEFAEFCVGCVCHINVINQNIYPFVCSIRVKEPNKSVAEYLVEHQLAEYINY